VTARTLPPIWHQSPDALWPDVAPVLLGVRAQVHELRWVEVGVRLLAGRAEVLVDVHDVGDAGVALVARLLGGPLRTIGMRARPDRWEACGDNRHRFCGEHTGIFHRLTVSVRRLGAEQLVEASTLPTEPERVALTLDDARQRGLDGRGIGDASNGDDPELCAAHAAGLATRAQYGGAPSDRPRGLGT
jgi:hypothetical protein